MQSDIKNYHNALLDADKRICSKLCKIILANLPYTEYKIWHAHPLWFISGNPIVGYHKLKDSVRLLFWSGQSFEEPLLKEEGKFKAAEIRYTNANEIIEVDVIRYLQKAATIQWDYKNIVKRKGVLIRIE